MTAADLKPGDVRDCGPILGLRHVERVERLHDDLLRVVYADSALWDEYNGLIHPDAEVEVVE